jgi:UDP-glucose 4-epimerase
MHYFVTGGAGFIGTHLVDRLVTMGSVTVYDNLTSGRKRYLKAHLEKKNFRFIEGDVLHEDSLGEAMKGADIVFHLAANSDIASGADNPRLDHDQGTVATFHVLECMRRNGVKTIFFPSGSGVYGDQGYTPVFEDFGPCLPISIYGASKLAAEGMISAYSHLFNQRALIFRIANVVGGRQTHGVVFDFIRKLKKNPTRLEIQGDGQQSKSYIHVGDLVGAIFFVLEKDAGSLALYNVAAEDYLDVTSIAWIVIKEMGLKDVELIYRGGPRGWKGDVPVVRFSLDKIRQLGWRARWTSEQAVRESVRVMLHDLP